MGYQYSYLIGSLVLLVIWLALFAWRKDIRKEMIIISVICGLAGPVLELIYILDWWHPLTITGTSIGIEDFLFGFTTGGVAAVIYEVIFKKKLTNTKKEIVQDYKFLPIWGGIVLGVFLFSFYVLKLHSYYASAIALVVPIIYIWYKRRDLVVNSLCSGALLVIASFPVYWVTEFITPGWIQNTWFMDKLSGILFMKIPVEDLVWFFLVGLFIGPFYEYWKGKKEEEKR